MPFLQWTDRAPAQSGTPADGPLKSIRRATRLGVLAALIPAALAADPALAAGRGSASERLGPRSAPARISCAGAIQHPIEVRIRALDPVVRGGVVRLELTASSRAPLARAEARLVSAGGTAVIGATRGALIALGERAASAAFQVRVPTEGGRFLLQFAVRGEGSTGPIERGATYNLLPDGPSTGRTVTASDGRGLVEFGARRLP